MIVQLRDALLEGFHIHFKPYVGKVIVGMHIWKNDKDYYFNKVCAIDEKEIAAAIEYIKSEIKAVME